MNPIHDIAGDYNFLEVLLWCGIGLTFLWRRRTLDGPMRGLALMSGIAFLLFGASDAVEMKTGAWWSPPWLFYWKASCGVAIVVLYVKYRRLLKSTQMPSSRGIQSEPGRSIP